MWLGPVWRRLEEQLELKTLTPDARANVVIDALLPRLQAHPELAEEFAARLDEESE